ncbi:MAG: hypothetical protein ACXVEF_34175 [Polyangiales bacterium]
MRALLALAALVAPTVSCVGTTGGALVTFTATASGLSSHMAGTPLVFTSGTGWVVSLERAAVHIGGLYLNQAVPTSGAQATGCISPGIYVAEVRAGVDVDVLSPVPKVFPVFGHGTASPASSGEVWLTTGAIDDVGTAGTILDVAGTATKAGRTVKFDGTISIGKNHLRPPNDPTLPGANPICRERIVPGIPVDLTPRDGGELHLEIDPSGWFANVDFADATPDAADPNHVLIGDESKSSASIGLYGGLRAASPDLYRFTWR